MNPKTMQAAILTEQNQHLIIDEVTLPEKLVYGQIFVKIFYSGICGSQIGEIKGVKGEDKYLPHLLGHEGVGEVLEVGPEVKYVKPGDHVIMHWRKGVGIEANPPKYTWNGKKINAGFVTTFNEYAVVSENRLTPVDHSFDLQVASLLGCAVTTGLGVITNNAKLRIGESIVVFGAGGVGLNIIQGAALTTAYPIIGVDLYDNKLEMARKFGATHVINSKRSNVEAAIQDIVGSQGADVCIDNTGNTQVINIAYMLTQSNGRIILVGVPKLADNISIYSLPLHFGKTISGSHGGETDPSLDIPRYIRLYQSGRLKLKELITDKFSLSDINVAIDKMNKGEVAGRCLIEM